MNNQITLTLSTQEAYNVWEAIQVMRNELSIARGKASDPASIIDPVIFEDLGEKVRQQI